MRGKLGSGHTRLSSRSRPAPRQVRHQPYYGNRRHGPRVNLRRASNAHRLLHNSTALGPHPETGMQRALDGGVLSEHARIVRGRLDGRNRSPDVCRPTRPLARARRGRACGRRSPSGKVLVCLLGLLVGLASLHAAGASAEQASQPSSPASGQLDTGGDDTCAVLAGGQVRCWGYGADGELGYPYTTLVGASDTPGAVGPVDLRSGRTAKAISTGDYHTCAILDDGSVKCWGFGANGRLGYANTDTVGDDETPGAVGTVDLGRGRTAAAISAGGGHTCAILDDGSVRCWGFGYFGELGYGNQNNVGDAQTPASVGPVDLGPGRTAKAISAGSRHTCAILDDGSVLCWGNGGSGRLGYGNTTNVGDKQTPASVGPVDLGPGRTATAISAGDAHTCAILDGGSVLCWGYGGNGELGYGNTNNVGDKQTPASVGPVDLGPGRTATAISAGDAHTCAILDDGSVRCWGYGAYGRLGYGNANNVGDKLTPASAGPVDLGPGRTAIAIAAGGAHTCARLDDGSVRCWGYGAYGQLGYCNQNNVGDTAATVPGNLGPVNLQAGDGGEVCPAIPVSVTPPTISGRAVQGQTLTEAHGTWLPTLTGYTYQWERCDRAGINCGRIVGAVAHTYTLVAADVGSRIRVLETASDGGASASAASDPTVVVAAARGPSPDAARKRGWRSCLARVNAAAKQARTLPQRGSKRQRALARRRLMRRLAIGRRRCVKKWGRTPGRVTGLRAITRGMTQIELDFTAVGTSANSPPAATTYLVKQSLRPILGARSFASAPALCNDSCRFAVTKIGTKIRLMITALLPRTAYYYQITARDNVSGELGPRSRPVMARTL